MFFFLFCIFLFRCEKVGKGGRRGRTRGRERGRKGDANMRHFLQKHPIFTLLVKSGSLMYPLHQLQRPMEENRVIIISFTIHSLSVVAS